MIAPSRHVQVWACSGPTDLRKGFDGLSALVEGVMKCDCLSGDLFLFVNRTRTMAKVLLWDGTGLCIYSKRLEKGRFACLWRASEEPSLRLAISELQLFLDGSHLVGKMPLIPRSLSRENLLHTSRL